MTFGRIFGVILILWLAIALFPEDTPIREKVWMSRTCTNSHWFIEDSHENSVTVECIPHPEQ